MLTWIACELAACKGSAHALPRRLAQPPGFQLAEAYKVVKDTVAKHNAPKSALSAFRLRFREDRGYCLGVQSRLALKEFSQTKTWRYTPKTLKQLVKIYSSKATAKRVAQYLSQQPDGSFHSEMTGETMYNHPEEAMDISEKDSKAIRDLHTTGKQPRSPGPAEMPPCMALADGVAGSQTPMKLGDESNTPLSKDTKAKKKKHKMDTVGGNAPDIVNNNPKKRKEEESDKDEEAVAEGSASEKEDDYDEDAEEGSALEGSCDEGEGNADGDKFAGNADADKFAGNADADTILDDAEGEGNAPAASKDKPQDAEEDAISDTQASDKKKSAKKRLCRHLRMVVTLGSTMVGQSDLDGFLETATSILQQLRGEV